MAKKVIARIFLASLEINTFIIPGLTEGAI